MNIELEGISVRNGRPAVMVIDDDDHMREALGLLLRHHGCGVECVSNAIGALARLHEGSVPDLILLDLLMPGMNGWEFRVEQKREPKWASIPVVALSADVSAQAAAIDAQAFLTKPVDGRVLLDTVDSLYRSLEMERAKARTIEVERLSSLGSLAAGLAHEINNPLALVLGNLELAQSRACVLTAHNVSLDAQLVSELNDALVRAQRGVERIASVVSGVSLFARPDTESVRVIDVQEVLEASLQVASNEIRHCARLSRSYEDVPPVLGNPAKLGQVFLNLLLNAVRTINESDRDDHVIRVTTRTGVSGTAEISVSDTGAGIAPATQSRIFDPSYLTSPFCLGMGFGLAVSRELVESMAGTIDVESQLGRGSTFRVRLPGHTRVLPAVASEVSSRPVVIGCATHRRRPRVVVLDDEPMMCDLVAALLADDYDVASFTDPRAALATMLQGDFDIILCDLMMPELTGMDVHERLELQRPELAHRVIFISGGAFTDRARSFLATTSRPQVRKPFRRDELIDAIEAQLRIVQ